jgi:hypothetical protein
VRSGKRASTTIPVIVDKPGEYTLFIDQSEKGLSNRFEMSLINKEESFHLYPLRGSQELKLDGEKFIAVGNFKLPVPGVYRVFAPDNSMVNRMIFAPAISDGFFLATIAALGMSMIFALLGWRFWPGRARFQLSMWRRRNSMGGRLNPNENV